MQHPPTLSVTADPDSLTSGDSSTITAHGSSPDNRPLSYSCNASAGSLSGNGPEYKLDTTGFPQGTLNVHCTVTDDRTLSTSNGTSVRVRSPKMAAAAEQIRQHRVQARQKEAHARGQRSQGRA